MDTVRRVGKTLQRTKKSLEFVLQRAAQEFPIVERLWDYLTPTWKFSAEFKTYHRDDIVQISLQFKERIIALTGCLPTPVNQGVCGNDGTNLSFGFTATAGNLLVIMADHRGGGHLTAPAGWNIDYAHEEGVLGTSLWVLSKISDGTELSIPIGGTNTEGFVYELYGAASIVSSFAYIETTDFGGDPHTLNALPTTSTARALYIGFYLLTVDSRGGGGDWLWIGNNDSIVDYFQNLTNTDGGGPHMGVIRKATSEAGTFYPSVIIDEQQTGTPTWTTFLNWRAVSFNIICAPQIPEEDACNYRLDDFERTEVDTWGTASSGVSWSSASGLSVTGTRGRIDVGGDLATFTQTDSGVITGVTAQDRQIRARVRFNGTTGYSGNPNNYETLLYIKDLSTGVFAELVVRTNPPNEGPLFNLDGGYGVTSSANISVASGTDYIFVFETKYSTGHWGVKLYPAINIEPIGWLVEQTNTGYAAGSPQLRINSFWDGGTDINTRHSVFFSYIDICTV